MLFIIHERSLILQALLATTEDEPLHLTMPELLLESSLIRKVCNRLVSSFNV